MYYYETSICQSIKVEHGRGSEEVKTRRGWDETISTTSSLWGSRASLRFQNRKVLGDCPGKGRPSANHPFNASSEPHGTGRTGACLEPDRHSSVQQRFKNHQGLIPGSESKTSFFCSNLVWRPSQIHLVSEAPLSCTDVWVTLNYRSYMHL